MDGVRAICGAKRYNGQACRYNAGHGTTHPGIGRCRKHGGGSPSGKAAAHGEQAERQLVELADSYSQERPDTGPHELLLEEVRRTAGLVDWLETRLRLRVPGETPDYKAALERRFDKERANLVKACATAIAAGVAERQVAIAEKWGGEIASMLRLILMDLELTKEQRDRAPAVIEARMAQWEIDAA